MWTLHLASADASSRRYFRVRAADGHSFIVMDSPAAEDSVSRRHVLLEPLPDGRARIERPVERRPDFGGHCRRRRKPVLHPCPESFVVQRFVEVPAGDGRGRCERDPAGAADIDRFLPGGHENRTQR